MFRETSEHVLELVFGNLLAQLTRAGKGYESVLDVGGS